MGSAFVDLHFWTMSMAPHDDNRFLFVSFSLPTSTSFSLWSFTTSPIDSRSKRLMGSDRIWIYGCLVKFNSRNLKGRLKNIFIGFFLWYRQPRCSTFMGLRRRPIKSWSIRFHCKFLLSFALTVIVKLFNFSFRFLDILLKRMIRPLWKYDCIFRMTNEWVKINKSAAKSLKP